MLDTSFELKIMSKKTQKLRVTSRNEWDYYFCIDSSGKEYLVRDLVRFCDINSLNYSAMVNCANGWSDGHKGWKCLHFRDAALKGIQHKSTTDGSQS